MLGLIGVLANGAEGWVIGPISASRVAVPSQHTPPITEIRMASVKSGLVRWVRSPCTHRVYPVYELNPALLTSRSHMRPLFLLAITTLLLACHDTPQKSCPASITDPSSCTTK